MNKKKLHSYVKDCIVQYGSYTLQDRAIPELKDGLKPVHRRIIWSAYVSGYGSSGTTKKSARIVGEVIGKYHPNGDMPVYGALVTLVNTANPLLVGQGNFGCKATDDDYAHMRYTESKLSKIAENYLLDKDYIAVTPMVPNYDGSEVEPVYLPAKLPIILTQNPEGIGTGASTNIPSFTIESVKKLIMSSFKKGKCTAEECLNCLEFKFGEGGRIIASKDELMNLYKTGEGKIFTIPFYEYDKKQHAIVLTSFSPRFKVEKAFNSALNLPEISDVENQSGSKKDSSGKSKIKLIFKLKKSITGDNIKTAAKKLLNAVGNYIPFSIMITDRRDDGKETAFRYSTIPNIVNDWMEWRLSFEVRVVERLISLEKEKIQRNEWLIWAIDNLKLIFEALRTDDPDKYLIKKGKISAEQAKYILDQQTRRLSKMSKVDLRERIKASKEIIKSHKRDISSKDNVAKRVIKGLEAIKS